VLAGCRAGEHQPTFRELAAETRLAIPVGAASTDVEQALRRLGYVFSWQAANHVYSGSRDVPGSSLVLHTIHVEVQMTAASRVEDLHIDERLTGP
jgi:hypothetical protein